MKETKIVATVLLGTLLFLAFNACSKKEEIARPPLTGAMYRKHYIDCYEEPYSLKSCKVVRNNDGTVVWALLFNSLYHPSGKGGKFTKLSKRYGDDHFNDYAIPKIAIAYPILSINLLARDDYDSKHPKGSSLNDIATLHYISSMDFISSGYKMEYYPGALLTCKVLEIPQDGLALLDQYMGIKLDNGPSSSGKHEIDLSLTFGDGKSMSCIVTVDDDNT